MKGIRQSLYIIFGILIIIVSFTGCSRKEDKEEQSYVVNYEGPPNLTASSDTKWIDSNIYGAIDSSLEISLKDDFHTAVNKEWLLSQTAPTDSDDDKSLLMEGMDIVKERLINIVSGKEDPMAMDGSQVDIDDDEIAHDQELVVRFVGAAADWDARNKAGVEPLRKYIADIVSISSMEELTDYIADLDERNVSQECLVGFETFAGAVDAQNYRCLLVPQESYVLREDGAYTNTSFTAKLDKRLTDKLVKSILEKLGYEEGYAERVLTDCYRMEGSLIDHINSKIVSSPDIYKDGKATLEELVNISGNFPLERIYNAWGYSDPSDIRIADRSYLKFLNRLYTDSNLEMIKAYYIVHTINNNILLLDRNYYDEVLEREEEKSENVPDDNGKGDVRENEIKDEWDLILNKYAIPFVSGPLNVVYISKYLSSTQKDDISSMVDDIIDSYHKILDQADWMSESARISALEKLDYITVRVLYPDKLDSYLGLSLDEEDDLVTMAHKIRRFKAKRSASKANKPVERDLWDLDIMATTDVNAYYRPDDNSINILAGIIAGDNVYNTNHSKEVNLARIGTVIGHEVSHAFDSTGCYYDKYGYNNTWWDINDLGTFQLRVTDLSNYYSGITPYPGGKNLTGSNLSGEAIADMGGMKAVLMIAKDMEGFDYDLFFRSYAQLWRTCRSLGLEASYADSDVHPLSYLRTNVTVMQFDEFINTYDIGEGDGMYIAPESRISVW